MKTIILDNGHGCNTKGKHSSNYTFGTLREWEFNRDIVDKIAERLDEEGIECVILVSEEEDVSLATRCRRANAICKERGVENCILISVHANAGQGTGFECFTSPGETKADRYATIMCEEFQAEYPHEKLRKDFSDGDPDKESEFYILMHTVCPALLTENFFYDNEEECRKLLDNSHRERIAQYHVNAIRRYI